MEAINNIKKFDFIIANPPYGKVGANITQNVINTIDFGDYINLMPMMDYIKNNTKDLFKHINLQNISKFSDKNIFENNAAVTTAICQLLKLKNICNSIETFKIESYLDLDLKKYFLQNLNFRNYAIENKIHLANNKICLNQSTSFVIAHRMVCCRHFPYDKNNAVNLWNLNKLANYSQLADAYSCASLDGGLDVYAINFNTAQEKTNFSNFIYSFDGFRFISKIFTAVNVDSICPIEKIFPRVDWTKSWDLKTLLREYNYTDNEVQAIIKDLSNFKSFW